MMMIGDKSIEIFDLHKIPCEALLKESQKELGQWKSYAEELEDELKVIKSKLSEYEAIDKKGLKLREKLNTAHKRIDELLNIQNREAGAIMIADKSREKFKEDNAKLKKENEKLRKQIGMHIAEINKLKNFQ